LSSDLVERLKKHNCRHKGFTGTTERWEIDIYAEVESKEEAVNLERKLKSFKNYNRARRYLERLIYTALLK
jgi:predicted GIY-YIG superfamily endonuclease